MNHDDQGQAGASGHSVPVSSLVLKRQAQARSPEELIRRFPLSCNKTKTARTEVIAEPTVASRPEASPAKITFRQDKMYYLSPFRLATVGSLPAYALGEEDQGHYKYRLATTIAGEDVGSFRLTPTLEQTS